MRFTISQEKRRSVWVILFSLLSVICLHVLFMAFSGKHLLSDNPYNSYAKQAFSWLQGRLYLEEDYSWLELAVYGGRHYVSFPPFPSYLLLPFAIFFGEETPDSLIAFFVMLVGVCYAAKIALRFQLNEFICVFFAVFLYVSNNLWQITVDGWVWFFAQNLSFTLSLMAFYHALAEHKGRACFCLLAAAGCRPFQLIYVPLLCLLLLHKQSGENCRQKWKSLLCTKPYTLLPSVLLGLSYLLLNALRFGNPFEFGHNYLPEFIDAEYGQFSLRYVGENLHNLFRLPVLDEVTGKMDTFGFDGINIFTVYPLLIIFLVLLVRRFCRAGPARKTCLRQTLPPLILCTVHIFFFLMHKTMGGAHFGNRYIADVMPTIYVLSVWCAAAPEREEARTGQGTRQGLTALYLLCALLFLGGLVFNFTGVLQFYHT